MRALIKLETEVFKIRQVKDFAIDPYFRIFTMEFFSETRIQIPSFLCIQPIRWIFIEIQWFSLVEFSNCETLLSLIDQNSITVHFLIF
jgi:hypothetical protein